MKAIKHLNRFAILLIAFLLSNTLSAQNYEQQGDELFSQAQYEKAKKKFDAAIAITGGSEGLNKKKANCNKCLSILAKATAAEQSSRYEEASKLYSTLYSINPIDEYKNKSTELAQIPIRIARQKQQAEQAERDRQAKIEKDRQLKDKERLAIIEKQRDNKTLTDSELARSLILHPVGNSALNWTDPEYMLKEIIVKIYPNLQANDRTISGYFTDKLRVYNHTVTYVSITFDSEKISVSYSIRCVSTLSNCTQLIRHLESNITFITHFGKKNNSSNFDLDKLISINVKQNDDAVLLEYIIKK